MKKIDFELTDLGNEKPKEVFQSFIELHENYLEYKTDYYSDENDETLGWQEGIYHYVHEIHEKKSISGIRITFKEKINQWKVLISAIGIQEDTFIMFNDELKAKDLFDKLVEWRYKK